jgi:hypothetical protein
VLQFVFKRGRPPGAGVSPVRNGLLAYLATTLSAALGVLLGLTLLREAEHSRSPQRVALTGNRLLDCLTQRTSQQGTHWRSLEATAGDPCP